MPRRNSANRFCGNRVGDLSRFNAVSRTAVAIATAAAVATGCGAPPAPAATGELNGDHRRIQLHSGGDDVDDQ